MCFSVAGAGNCSDMRIAVRSAPASAWSVLGMRMNGNIDMRMKKGYKTSSFVVYDNYIYRTHKI
jgi:hypothetical protein